MCFRSRRLLFIGFAALSWASTAPAAEPATKEIEVNGVTLSYVDEGTGEPIVFVHGAVSDLRAWEPIREAIADEHRFIALTQRYFGTGQWTGDGKDFGEATHAADLAAFIKTLDIGPVHLVGWSYGANVAALAALENPDLVQSVVLFEPALDSFIKQGEAGNAAREAQGKMFGPGHPGRGSG
jgi:pimeloyl-ACP methyl ester carboxylesterase